MHQKYPCSIALWQVCIRDIPLHTDACGITLGELAERLLLNLLYTLLLSWYLSTWKGSLVWQVPSCWQPQCSARHAVPRRSPVQGLLLLRQCSTG